ncbi:hypothetical protein [Kitasatospora sp. NPDC057198]|uniref:hypothetical protein n=1 Tax=Kitasatospora sp. NPDC057198 TaxID=3346046 RepID=UPI003637163A
MRSRTPFAALAAALLAVALVAGCSDSEETWALSDPTAAQHRIDSLVDGTLKAITPAVTIPEDWWYDYDEKRTAFGKETGYADVWRKSYLEQRIAEGKKRVLLDQVEKHWKDQGCTVNPEKPAALQVYVSAVCADQAWAMLEISRNGVAFVEARVNGTKYPGGPSPFPNTHSPQPTASKAPDEQWDDPYWSH